ncbi:pyruvate decarboxylase [Punctularia strigosozonata HHB-11173 SS5]|uniref:pyruvate decarboxylase n=1 Tax=Punctularia strigosozonata (strain HHB-11173) TaxID=741275 RepID=UPI0004417587|nr:pyruvate decarboxylase [Punctularia strigosozonata HHB-11173 SS5]EIN12769.1 pyruvate decarboxylase [Punctularia strigosozonata HHB-11173 SS5]
MSSAGLADLTAEVANLRQQLELAKHAETPSEEIFVGAYLLERLAQLGVTSLFGVPGDFNLGFLDLVEDHEKIDWIGNCNELNAAYAADGYARVKEHSIGALLTTFGVGELSAVNGIAGAFSEMVPVVHIVGVPSTDQQKNKPMLHHTLGDGRYTAYLEAYKQFTVAHASLNNAKAAPAEIDRVLEECIIQGRPTYIMLPTDIAYAKTSSSRLKVPLKTLPPPNVEEVEEFVLDEIVKQVHAVEDEVIILVDACSIRHHVREELAELLESTKFPVYSAPMGKTAVAESSARYGGIYVGTISRPEVKEKVENAKLILSIGGLKSDFNTGNFSYQIPTTRTIELHSDHTKIQFATYPGLGMKSLIPKLTKRLARFKESAKEIAVPKFELPVPQEADDVISHAWLWPTVGTFFKPKDVIVAETGTSSFGILDVPLPDNSIFVSQILWGSIGWTVGSTLGAALAARDLGLGRTILFIGDGSMQLTVQELSTMIRHKLNPIIFLLNNSGYTIERYLHGKYRKYNDIVNWKWTKLLDTLGGEDGKTAKSYTVHNKQELNALLTNPEFAAASLPQLVEVMMPQHDAPRALKVQAELSGKTNKYVADVVDKVAPAS